MSESNFIVERNRLIAIIAAVAILTSGLTFGLIKVSGGLAAKTGNAITVTGSASTSATADNAVWTLNVQEMTPTVSAAVKKVENSVVALQDYLTKGGITASQIELGAISTSANEEYLNGSATGRILSYRANRTVIVRSKDVQLIQKLSNGIGEVLQTGVNVYNFGPAYYVSNLNELRPKLMAEAMKDAKVRADSITNAVGGKAGSVLAVRSGPIQVTTPDSTDRSAGGIYDVTTINKTITATVSVDFKTK